MDRHDAREQHRIDELNRAVVEPHFTLKEALARFFPGGQLTVSSLRRRYHP